MRKAVLASVVFAAAASAVAASAVAAEYASVAAPGAILYDGPSPSAHKAFVAPAGMPIELLSVIRLWVKVRDASGDVTWIERSSISPARTVVTLADAFVRTAPREQAPVVLLVAHGVMLELVEGASPAGWARVRHRDGTTGYARAVDLWGL